ncbi:DNA modification methylase [Altererythrobacter xiamenensis]|uniref:site-specific DNA-methyltransferase (adenine-specific) n=2 Tax=Altererythrobacter xiamenensis TaxID=1316679 RepID=A0A1Y6F4L8_9SPHN|nr:DNA modification methylase [Altererythrobacter xiamenensis]
MNSQDHPKKASPAAAKVDDIKTTSKAPSGGSKKLAAKGKMFSDKMKEQLQAKSRSRRKEHAARTRVVDAASRPARNDLSPELVVTEKPLADLQPSPNRTRITSPEQLEKVISSIRLFGLVMPVLIDQNDVVVSGHILCEAAEQLGFKSVPCISVEHLDNAEIEALALALNRVGETGAWDTDLLRERMIALESDGIDLTSTGFTLPEIDQITLLSQPADGDNDADEFEEDEDDRPVVSRLGDLYQLGVHRLHCADALKAASYEALLEGQLAQCIFSDAPYGCGIEGFVSGLGKHKHEDFLMGAGDLDREELQDFFGTYLGHCKAFSSPGAIIFACMDWRQLDALLLAGLDVGLTRNNIAVWDKGSGGMGGLYRNAHEFVAVFCNGKTAATNNIALGRYGRDRCNIWRYPGANRPGSSSAKALADHPTPKPLPLVEDALLDVTNRGDIVLDPFMGSGSTILAAENTGRICYGIELDPKYVDRAIRRWERETGEPAIHIETGLTFDELAQRRISEGVTSHG